jgi:hypothetical protein
MSRSVFRRSTVLVTAVAVGVAPLTLSLPASAQDAGDPRVVGLFAAPFEEPGPRCVPDPDDPARSECKPAAGTVGVLPNGKIVYWDALQGMQDNQGPVAKDYGHLAQNSAARVLDLRGETPTWEVSDPESASDPEGNDGEEFLPGGLNNNDEKGNDTDLFCSDQIFLADGRVLDVGGTGYYEEPGIPGRPMNGVIELEGLKNSRIFDPKDNTWTASGKMTYGRWYPSVVTLPDGKVLAVSGVTKLIKPVYPNRPSDSGRNVTQSEVYDPATGSWQVDGGNKSLPLYPRIHLLPNGNVYYDAAGQTFSPSGQAYDEASWNMASSYNPKTKTWKDLGVPTFGNGLVGFRGSAFSQMLPLRPNDQGEYDTVDVLSAGGVYGVTPGTYLGTDTSTLNTVKLGSDGSETFSSKNTGSLNIPRWYSTGVTLPTGEVIAFSGADRDEVVAPGSGTPITTPEMYDPKTGTWTELTDAANGRTYHNTATLLPDGRVLVGGHAPIGTLYGPNDPTLKDRAGFSDPARDPSFEIFSPPNLFYGERPVITDIAPSVRRGSTLEIATPDAADISSVTIVRNTVMTHLVDADQRIVELPVVARTADSVTVAVTDNAAVLPDGPYNVFVNQSYAKGETPSVGRQVFVGGVPAPMADEVSTNNATASANELDARAEAADAAPANSRRAAAAPAAGEVPARAKAAEGEGEGENSDEGRREGQRQEADAIVAAAPAVRLVSDRRSSTSQPAPVTVLAGALLAGGALAGNLLVRRRRRA